MPIFGWFPVKLKYFILFKLCYCENYRRIFFYKKRSIVGDRIDYDESRSIEELVELVSEIILIEAKLTSSLNLVFFSG